MIIAFALVYALSGSPCSAASTVGAGACTTAAHQHVDGEPESSRTMIVCRPLRDGTEVCAPRWSRDGAPVVHVEEDGSASYADGESYDPNSGWTRVI